MAASDRRLTPAEHAPHRLAPADHNAAVLGATEYVPFIPRDVPRYEGAYEVTPSATAQVLPTESLLMSSDLTINPIPSNYGLITWTGAVLTVS